MLLLLFLLLKITFAIDFPVQLQNAEYFKLELNEALESYDFSFTHPNAHPAQSSNRKNTFSLIFNQNITADSSMSLRISRDSEDIFDSQQPQQIDTNILGFEFPEFDGDISLELLPSASLRENNVTCFVVFNIEPVILKQPNFSDIGDFIYTKQYFSGTYSHLNLNKTYQIYIKQAGYLLIKKYDCLGQGELILTSGFSYRPKIQALKYQTLIQPPTNESYVNYEPFERIYTVQEGVYHLFILPLAGMQIQTGSPQKAYFTLQVTFSETKPQILIMPPRAIRNFETLQIEGDPENLQLLKATFYPLSSGLKEPLDMDITYNIYTSSNSLISDYYSKCGVEASRIQELEMSDSGSDSGSQSPPYTLEKLKINLESTQQQFYMLKGVDIQQTDLSIALEARITYQSAFGPMEAKAFYTTVSMKRRSAPGMDENLILIIVGGVLLLLSIPIWAILKRLINVLKKRSRGSKYDVSVINKKDKEKLKPKDSLSIG